MARLGIAGKCLVRQDDIDGVIVELHHEVPQTTGAQDEFHVTPLSKCFEKLPLEVA